MSVKTGKKSLLANEEIKIKELAKKLRGNRFNEVKEILDVLGYDIEFKKRN